MSVSFFRRVLLSALVLGLSSALPMKAQLDLSYHHPVLEDYFAPASAAPAMPDAEGFIRRWSLLEPIAKPEIRTNAIFDDFDFASDNCKWNFRDR